MSLENLTPHAGKHAIENAVLALEWGVELTAAQLEEVRSAVKPVLKDFPREEPQQTFRVSLSPIPGAAPMPTHEIGGYVYSRYTAEGNVPKQVQLTRTNCLFVVTAYTRWKDLIAEAGNVFAQALSALPVGIPVSNIGLQYSDRFKWSGNPADLDLSQVFRFNSPFVASHVSECRLACHSHHGYFEDSSEPIPNRRLDNINVNIVDEAEGRTIQIVSSHRAALTEQLTGVVVQKHVNDIQEYLHDVHKDIIRKMLCDELLIKIGFELEE